MTFCSWCGDEYSPVEYRPASFDGPNFCSSDHEEAQGLAEAAYEEGRHSGAPVH